MLLAVKVHENVTVDVILFEIVGEIGGVFCCVVMVVYVDHLNWKIVNCWKIVNYPMMLNQLLMLFHLMIQMNLLYYYCYYLCHHHQITVCVWACLLCCGVVNDNVIGLELLIVVIELILLVRMSTKVTNGSDAGKCPGSHI